MLKQEGYDLIGAALEVYHTLGGGMAEEIYQQSFELELSDRGIPFDSKRKLKIFYKKRELDTTYIPDITAFEAIIGELKSVREILPEHEAQLLNYMRITNSPVGYILNFGPVDGLQWKRYVLSKNNLSS